MNVVVVPVPVAVKPPGVAVTVHVPLAGKPLKDTSPVAITQVGCVILPITGIVGVNGCALITTFVVEVELHVPSFTMNVYVPATNPATVVVVPVPVVVPLGLPVTVHVPVDGKPLKSTLPVAIAQDGCVTVPTIGVVGTPKTELITAFVLAEEVHVPLLTVKV